jgi:Fe2+ or Zn2+ uptake regulation protein
MHPSRSDRVTQMLLAEPDGLRAPEILRRLKPSISQPTLWRVLHGLRAEGRITAQGRGRASRYCSTERSSLPALRSRRLHRCVAERLVHDASTQMRQIARKRLQQLRHVNPHGQVYHDRWAALLDGPPALLFRTMTEESEHADALRKESPFTVLVTPTERRRIFGATRAV